MSDQYKITEEQKKLLLQISAQTLPDNPSRDGYSAEQIRGRLYKPYAALIDLINGVFGTAYNDVSEIQEAIENGDFYARSFVQWSATYTYGANEITYYPVGTYGALVKSLVANNTNNEPYTTGGVPNSAFWEEVLNFDGALSEAQGYAASAATSATDAAQSATAAENYKDAASDSASSAAASVIQANTAASSAIVNASAAERSMEAAAESATAAANSATEAQEYAQQAKEYAQKHYAVYPSFDALPVPGDSAFIYLVPVDEAETNNNYTEYLWITDLSSYESIGTVNDIDLSGYAQINGTYAGMTVGNATNAQTAQNAQQLGGVAASQYAKVDGTYSGMIVGYAYGAGNDSNGNNIAETYATKAENNAKYTKPSTGIPKTDLASAVQTSLNKADTAYQKPSGGIPKTDLASAVQASLGKADSAYQKPSTGIPKGDLASAVQTSLNKADTALQSVPLATASAVGGVKPVAKTDDMTQSVGVDSNGALWTEPGGDSIEYMTDDEVDALFGSASTLISFTFEGTTYNAMSGWTWQQFIDSEYNPDGNYFSAAGEYVATPINGGSNVLLNGTRVLLTDVIQANAAYTAESGGGTGGGSA